MDPGGNDGWRQGDQDPSGYHNYAQRAAMGADGGTGGASANDGHGTGYQAQMNYDYGGGDAQEGDYSQQGYSQNAASGGSYHHGFQTQGYSDGNNNTGYADYQHAQQGFSNGMGGQQASGGYYHDQSHPNTAQGGTSIDDARGLMLFSQAQAMAQSSEGMGTNTASGTDAFGSSSNPMNALLALATQPRVAAQEQQEGNNMGYEARNQQGGVDYGGMTANSHTRDANKYGGMGRNVSMQDVDTLASLAATRAPTQANDIMATTQQEGGWQGGGMCVAIGGETNTNASLSASQSDPVGTEAPLDQEEMHSPPMKKRLVEAGAFGDQIEVEGAQFDDDEEQPKTDAVNARDHAEHVEDDKVGVAAEEEIEAEESNPPETNVDEEMPGPGPTEAVEDPDGEVITKGDEALNPKSMDSRAETNADDNGTVPEPSDLVKREANLAEAETAPTVDEGSQVMPEPEVENGGGAEGLTHLEASAEENETEPPVDKSDDDMKPVEREETQDVDVEEAEAGETDAKSEAPFQPGADEGEDEVEPAASRDLTTDLGEGENVSAPESAPENQDNDAEDIANPEVTEGEEGTSQVIHGSGSNVDLEAEEKDTETEGPDQPQSDEDRVESAEGDNSPKELKECDGNELPDNHAHTLGGGEANAEDSPQSDIDDGKDEMELSFVEGSPAVPPEPLIGDPFAEEEAQEEENKNPIVELPPAGKKSGEASEEDEPMTPAFEPEAEQPATSDEGMINQTYDVGSPAPLEEGGGRDSVAIDAAEESKTELDDKMDSPALEQVGPPPAAADEIRELKATTQPGDGSEQPDAGDVSKMEVADGMDSSAPDAEDGGVQGTTANGEPDADAVDESNKVEVTIQPEAANLGLGGTEQPDADDEGNGPSPEKESQTATPEKSVEEKMDIDVEPDVESPYAGDESNQVQVAIQSEPVPEDRAGKGETETSAVKRSSEEEEKKLPSPKKLPSTGLVSLRGKLEESGGVHKIHGLWALGLETILDDPENTKGLCLDFEYEHQSSGEANEFPKSGQYSGWFSLNGDDGKPMQSPETDVQLTFIKNSGGYYNVEGTGSNVFGSYLINGTFTADGVITMCRKFQPKPKPKPKRTKKVASRRRSKTPTSGKRKRRSSKGGQSKSATPKKRMGTPRHKDSGKRYGVGKPGLLCDCCFFEEDGEVAQTPFIKCIYCGLVAHSACYPPISSVDAKGNFLCDVCTTYFHPSVNKQARTKHSPDGNIPPPKPLASDVEAKSDGRHHGTGIYCQLCARNDVLGGMKPTNTNAWVHLACLMSAESAFFDDQTAVGVQGALKKNRTELIKQKKVSGNKPKCEECSGESGMLLKCKEEGCTCYVHALCAEILDRLRVVENNGERDVISYKCTLHSYGEIDACGICKLSNKQSEMLECDKCQQGYHMGCLTPPLTEVPDGDWFCDKCA